MGSELVNGSASLFSYSELFREQCIVYMSIGMSYEEFWEMDVDLVKFYREAEQLKQKRRDYDLWLQGRYIYDALCAVSPVLHAFAPQGTKAMPYLEEPYPRTRKELRERQKKIMKENAETFRALVELKNEERRKNNVGSND